MSTLRIVVAALSSLSLILSPPVCIMLPAASTFVNMTTLALSLSLTRN